MLLTVMAALGLVMAGCDKKTTGGGTGGGTTGGGGGGTTPPVAKGVKYDAYASWGACKEGSSVTFETETAGMKMTVTKTLDKKGDEKHTLKTETVMKVGENETKTPGEEPVPKATAGTGDPAAKCPTCQNPVKDHKDETRWAEEPVKVDGKDVKCWKMQPAEKLCDGKDNPGKDTTMWYSNDVPGQLVKMETAQMKMTLVKFEKK